MPDSSKPIAADSSLVPPPLPPAVASSPATPRPPVDWRAAHLWQIQPVRDVLILATIFGILYLGYVLSIVTVPLLLAVALAYLVEPVVGLLTRRGKGPLGRGAAAGIIIVSAILLFAVPATLVVGYGVLQGSTVVRSIANSTQLVVSSAENPDDQRLTAQVNLLGPRWVRVRDAIVRVRAEASKLNLEPLLHDGAEAPPADAASLAAGAAPPTATSIVAAQIYTAIEGLAGWAKTNAASISKQAFATGSGVVFVALGFLGSIGYLGFSIFLTGFFFFFFCSSWGRVLIFWQSLIPERQREPVFDLVRQMDAVIAGFIRGRLMICGINMIYFTIAYSIIGVPAPLVMGPLVGFLSLAPYVATAGMFIAIALKFLDPGSDGLTATWYWAVFAPIAVHGAQQLLEDYYLTPTIQGKTTNMDTPTILFASLAGGILAGFYGLLLAIPVVACIKIVLKHLVMPRLAAWARGDVKDPLPLQ